MQAYFDVVMLPVLFLTPGVCRGNVSQHTSHSPESKKRKVSLGTSGETIGNRV